MRRKHQTTIGKFAQRLATTAALLCLCLLTAASAQASPYEQVGCFAGPLPGPLDSCKPVAEEKFGEEVQLKGVGGMAVNYTGAGGVPAGTVYAARYSPFGEGLWIAMYEPEGEGLKFVEAWRVLSEEGEYERCGPLLGMEVKEGKEVPKFSCKATLGGSNPGKVDVDIDQATGNVYALQESSAFPVGTKLIVTYKADGSAVIGRFGEQVPATDKVATSPEGIHNSPSYGGLAVNGAGDVYVYDETGPADNFHHRLMVFSPQSPGDFEHYVYAGEVAAGFAGEGRLPNTPVSDAAGNIYVSGETYIEEYAPEAPAPFPAPPSSPICHFDYAKGGITAITVNPQSGEVFFFTYKKEAGFKHKLIHQLGPCDEETGEFTEVGQIEVSPERDDLTGLAFDPMRQLPLRPAGVLYGGAPGAFSSFGVGKGEPGQSSLGYVFAQAKDLESPPKVEAESVSHVTSSAALLHAQINPGGFATDYRFQYLTEAEYEAAGKSFEGAKEAPLGGATLGGGKAALIANAPIAGLAPQTAYRYRVLATSHCNPAEAEKLCQVPGAAKSFRTFPLEVPGLPDDRAWELVSPAQKQGGQVLPADPRIRSCQLVGTLECKPGGTYRYFPMQSSPDGEAIVYEGTPFGDEGAAIENEYISHRDPKAGWQTTVLTPKLLDNASYGPFDRELTGGVLDQLRPTLSPEAPAEYANLYFQSTADPLALAPLLREAPPNRPASGAGEFQIGSAVTSEDGSRVFLSANDALTGETPVAPAALDGGASKSNLYEWEATSGQLQLVNVLPENTATEPGASFGGLGNAHAISADGTHAFWSDESGQVYVRIDGEETRKIEDPGKFLSASTDGSRVLLDDGCLYDVEAEACTDLTDGKGGFQGPVGQSEDLSHVYFVDTAVLDETPNEEGEAAVDKEFNLYSWHEGATRFVARLVSADNDTGPFELGPSSDWTASRRTAEASPNGTWVTFLSRAPLTGYDSTGPCQNGVCPEAFLYDSQTEALICASCNPSGAAPLGWSTLRVGSPNQPRYLTNQGRLYFDSADSLSPFDTNEGVEDVYQWQPKGLGNCESQFAEGGCLSLISAGTGNSDSNFLAMDEDGRNAFFTTRDQLVLKDRDELIDLYDARIEGGISSETEARQTPCQGEACAAALTPPNDPTPGSSSFEGAGNVDEKKAAKKHKSKKHAKKHKSKGHAHKRANHNRGGAK